MYPVSVFRRFLHQNSGNVFSQTEKKALHVRFGRKKPKKKKKKRLSCPENRLIFFSCPRD